jgi:hypothetical protein
MSALELKEAIIGAFPPGASSAVAISSDNCAKQMLHFLYFYRLSSGWQIRLSFYAG